MTPEPTVNESLPASYFATPPEEARETVVALERTFPDGWRSGSEACDALTFLFARDLRRMLGHMWTGQAVPIKHARIAGRG